MSDPNAAQTYLSHTPLPLSTRILISTHTLTRHQRVLSSLRAEERHIAALMTGLDEFDVTSARYHVLMSQRIAVWNDIEEVRGKVEGEEEMLRLLVGLKGKEREGEGEVLVRIVPEEV